MHEKLNLLKQVQGIESEMVVARDTYEGYADELAALDSECSQIKGMIDSLDDELQQLQAQRRELELELDKENDRIAQVEARLPQIKTQKEYVAVLKEIDAAKKDNRETEDAISQQDESIQALSAEKEEKEATHTTLAETLATRKAELSDEMAQLSTCLDQHASKREKLLQDLPIQLRKRYMTLAERREGLAVVSAKGGACQGCHMHLPPQTFNSLHRNAKIETCPHCNRILFLDQED